MNDIELQLLIDEAIALQRDLSAKTERLKTLKSALIAEAQNRPETHVPTESGGKRWTALGSDGCLARVSFPVPSLTSEIDSGTADKIKKIAPGHFDNLFVPVTSYRPVRNLRTLALELLPKWTVEAVLALCESEIAPRVSFEAARKLEVAA